MPLSFPLQFVKSITRRHFQILQPGRHIEIFQPPHCPSSNIRRKPFRFPRFVQLERLLIRATVPELPGCSAFGDTEEEAIKEVKVAASLWLAAAKKAKRPIPEPIIEKTFKARFPLRIPEDLRRRLELEAKRKGVSLNHLILQRIA